MNSISAGGKVYQIEISEYVLLPRTTALCLRTQEGKDHWLTMPAPRRYHRKLTWICKDLSVSPRQVLFVKTDPASIMFARELTIAGLVFPAQKDGGQWVFYTLVEASSTRIVRDPYVPKGWPTLPFYHDKTDLKHL